MAGGAERLLQDSANVVNRQTLEDDPLGAALALQRVQILARQPGPRRGNHHQPLICAAWPSAATMARPSGLVKCRSSTIHHRPLPRESARQLREQALEDVG